jgi:hypothetical protein
MIEINCAEGVTHCFMATGECDMFEGAPNGLKNFYKISTLDETIYEEIGNIFD